MKKYRHKEWDTIIEAEEVRQDTIAGIAHKTGGHVVKEEDKERGMFFVGLNILTGVGWVRASEGDYVLDTAHGLYVLKRAHFKRVYEEAPVRAEKPAHQNAFENRGGKINGQNG